MQSPEQIVQNNIELHLKQLQKSGKLIFFEKRQAGGFNYKMGIPDMYIVINGKHVEVEIKKPGGKTSPMQDAWQRKFKKLNIECYVVSSWEQLYSYLEKDLV